MTTTPFPNPPAEALTHTTEGGLVLTLKPVRMVLVELATMGVEDEMRAEGRPVDPPTFTLTLATGETETLEHVYDPENEINTLVEPDDARATAANYARWRMYEKALEELEDRQGERRMKEMFRAGLTFEGPTGDDWADDLRARSAGKIEIPEDNEVGAAGERAYMWLWYTQLSQMDVQQIHLKLMVLSQGQLFSEEQFQGLQASLQSKVAKSVWAGFEEFVGEDEEEDEPGAGEGSASPA